MATFMKFYASSKHGFIEEWFDRNRLAEENREVEYHKAVRIQAWWRKLLVKWRLVRLQECVINAQRVFRGWQGRRKYREMMFQNLAIMRAAKYNKCATVIQSSWRGYYTRKFVHNFFKRKKYLQTLVLKNELVKKEIEAQASINNQESEQREQEKQDYEDVMKLSRMHHLMSTRAQPGVFALDPGSELDLPIEQQMEEAFALSFTTGALGSKRPKLPKYDLNVSGRGRKNSSESSVLPPLKKVQGPFKSPEAVYAQRHKPLAPSLRVESDFNGKKKAEKAERSTEWTRRVSDEQFRYFFRTKTPYQRTLQGSEQFSEKVSLTRRAEAPFKPGSSFLPIVPPISLFDELNQTYQ